MVGVVVLACGRMVMRLLWAAIATLVVVAHPLLRTERAGEAALQGELIKFATLLCLLAIAKTTWNPRRRPLTLFGLAAATVTLGGLALLTTVDAGAVVLLFCLVGMCRDGVGWRIYAGAAIDRIKGRPCLNVVVVGLFALMIPAGMLGAAYGLSMAKEQLPDTVSSAVLYRADVDHSRFDEFVRHLLPLPAPENHLPGFALDQLPYWAWPYHWVLLAFAGLGLLRTLMRGATQCSKREAPLGWVLLIFALSQIVVAWLAPQSLRDLFFVPWAALTIFLAVFGIGDSLRAFSERMILAAAGGSRGETRKLTKRTRIERKEMDQKQDLSLSTFDPSVPLNPRSLLLVRLRKGTDLHGNQRPRTSVDRNV